jgi:hypothetical protein
MTGGAVNITVPAGQIWEIFAHNLTTLVTAAARWSIEVDGKSMYWSQGCANFDPSLGMLANLNPGLMEDVNRFGAERIPVLAAEGQVITVWSTDNSGVVVLSYRIHTLNNGLSRISDGGTESKKRLIFSNSLQVTSVALGATVDILINTNFNAPGETVFPWGGNVPPQRVYKILALVIGVTNTVGTNLTRNGIRLLHEGRELLTPGGLVQTPANVCPHVGVGALFHFLPEPYEVNSFEQVTVYNRVTSTDAGAQDATLYNGLFMIEEFLS